MEKDENEAVLVAAVDGTEIGDITLTNEWSEIEFEFALDSETPADALVLTLDGAFIFDFADLKLEKSA